MQTDKNKWIEEVMQSVDGVSRTLAPDMTNAVMSRLGRADEYRLLPMSKDNGMIWRIAASLVFLLLLNAVTIYSYQNNMAKTKQDMQSHSVATELGISNNNSTDIGSVFFGK